jgi:hypothetical protein
MHDVVLRQVGKRGMNPPHGRAGDGETWRRRVRAARPHPFRAASGLRLDAACTAPQPVAT